MDRSEIEYCIYDTVEILKISKDLTIRLRGFLNHSIYNNNYYSKTSVELIYPHNKKLEVINLYANNILPCRMVLFEKFIMNDDEFIRRSIAIRKPRKRVSAIRRG